MDTILLRQIPFLIALTLTSGCSWLGSQPAPESNSNAVIDIQHAGLLVNDQGGRELGLSLRNISAQTLWVSVRFQTPDNSSDCELGSELAPNSEHVFVCPQNRLLPAVNYPILIRAYSDLEQSTELTTLETGLRFDAADIQAAGL